MSFNLNQAPFASNLEPINFSIRQASENDCDAIRALYKKIVQSLDQLQYNPNQILVWSLGADDISAWLKRITTQHFIVAEYAGEIIGFGSITDEGYLDLLYVDQFHQGKGVGRKILKKLESYCSKNHILEIWADINSSSRNFFTRHGYRVDKIYTRSVKNCDFENLIMRKILVNQEVN